MVVVFNPGLNVRRLPPSNACDPFTNVLVRGSFVNK